MRPTRLLPALAIALLAGAPAPLRAQPAPAPAADPVVARVDGTEIHLSDVSEAAQALPAQYRALPQSVLFPLLTDQLIDRAAVTAMARRQGFDKDPAVARQMARAADQALETAVMQRDIAPAVTEEALRARYDRDIAGKPGEPEVHARHILVATEAEARQIIEELRKGGDFAAIAKARSKDPGAAQGGDLGFFKEGDMVPEFAAAAFALQPGQISEKPVKTQFGWHVIKVEERRNAPAPTFEEARDDLRQAVIQEEMQKVLATAREGLRIERFNADGSPRRATDTAAPPAPPAPKP